MPLESRHADSVRHLAHTQSGDDVWRAVASRELPTRPTSRSAGATAREALRANGFDASWCAGAAAVCRGRHCQRHDQWSKRVSYGELVGGKKFEVRLNRMPRGSTPARGPCLARRFDIPALATGRFEFVHNVRVPGMLHGRVVRPPSSARTSMTVDQSS